MTLDWEYLVSGETGDTPAPLSSLHTVRLLTRLLDRWVIISPPLQKMKEMQVQRSQG
jgi:hypothetical protein